MWWCCSSRNKTRSPPAEIIPDLCWSIVLTFANAGAILALRKTCRGGVELTKNYLKECVVTAGKRSYGPSHFEGNWIATYGPLIATVGDVVRVYSVSLLYVLDGHSAETTSCAFSHDGRLVTTSKDRTAKIWDGQELLVTLSGHRDWVTGCAFAANLVATASSDQKARIWNSWTGELLHVLKHGDWVKNCAFSTDEKMIATASHDSTAQLWDSKSGNLILSLKGHRNSVLHCAFSPDGYRVATTSGDRTVRTWCTKTGKSHLILFGHTGFVSCVSYSSDSLRLLSSDDKTARLWDAITGQPLSVIKLEKRYFTTKMKASSFYCGHSP